MARSYLTVSQLNYTIKSYIETQPILQSISLKGEISNFKAHTSGHFYFSLKDEKSRVKAIMFRGNTTRLKFSPMDGMKVLVHGKIGVYEATGEYQIYVDEMMEDGIGNLYIALEQLKEKLAKEGLFAKEHKKPIPRYPTKVGVVTASTGAAIKDIISTIKRRYPICEVILFPSLVQGSGAKEDIAKKIAIADDYQLDVLIVGRGGGSIEDLWAFNEEVVARAIYQAKTPIISAVGHEIDFTIADLVADLRAPTPTAAAELAVPNVIDLLNLLAKDQIRLNQTIHTYLSVHKDRVQAMLQRPVIRYPMRIYEVKAQKLDYLTEKAIDTMEAILQNKWNRFLLSSDSYLLKNPTEIYKDANRKFQLLLEKCELLNPLNSLKRGYAIIKKGPKAIQSIQEVSVKDTLLIQLKDGMIHTTVTGKEGTHGKDI